MVTFDRRRGRVGTVAIAILCWACSAQAQGYTITPLPHTGAYAFSDAGLVVGAYLVPSTSNYAGTTFDVATGAFSAMDFGSRDTRFFAVNAAGIAVGWRDVEATLFDLNTGTYRSLNRPAEWRASQAEGINNAGIVVGSYVTYSSRVVGFIYDPATGRYTDLAAPGGRPGDGIRLRGINDAGQIIGSYDPAIPSRDVQFLYTGGTFRTVAFPGAVESEVRGINDSGIIVGSYGNGTFFVGGFLYDPVADAYTDFVLPDSRRVGLLGINNNGQLLGYREDLGGSVVAFIATPTPATVPEPTTMMLTGSGLVLVASATGAGRRRARVA